MATPKNYDISTSGVTGRRSASELRSHIMSSCSSNHNLGLDTQGEFFWLQFSNPTFSELDPLSFLTKVLRTHL